MSSARLCTLLALGAAALGCHPLSPWHAPAYVTDDVPRLVARDARGPSDELEVLVDPLGVPHIFGASEADLAYGLAEVGLGATAGCVEVHNDALRPPRSRQKP